MANWKIKINVSEIWEQFEEGFEETRDSLISELNTYIEEVEEQFGEDEAIKFENLISDLANCEDEEEFDWSWNDLYDWADSNLIWIQTF